MTSTMTELRDEIEALGYDESDYPHFYDADLFAEWAAEDEAREAAAAAEREAADEQAWRERGVETPSLVMLF